MAVSVRTNFPRIGPSGQRRTSGHSCGHEGWHIDGRSRARAPTPLNSPRPNVKARVNGATSSSAKRSHPQVAGKSAASSQHTSLKASGKQAQVRPEQSVSQLGQAEPLSVLGSSASASETAARMAPWMALHAAQHAFLPPGGLR